MARTEITRTTPLGPYPSLPVSADALDAALTAGNAASGNYFTVAGGKQLLIAHNTASTPYYMTLTSAEDEKNRSGDVAEYDIGVDEVATFLFKSPGWRNSSNQVNLEVENAKIFFAVVDLD